MMKKRYRVALGALSAVLGACGASESKAPPGGSGGSAAAAGAGAGGTATAGSSASHGGSAGSGVSSAGRGGMSANGSGGTGAAAGASGATGGSAGTEACTPGIPATSQVPRMKNAAYDSVLRDLLGVTTLASASGSSNKPSDLLYPDSDGDLVADAWRLYQDTASTIAQAVMTGSNKTNFIACDPAASGCLSDTIESFGRKAFRRPLTAAEVTSFLRLTNAPTPGTPDEVAEAILYTFLASPSFLLLPELGQDKEGDALKLTDYEVATRLSFLLWNSVPDGALNDAADNGQLETKDQILAQAQRMLKDTRTQTALTAFGRAYLGIVPGSFWLGNTTHDPTAYPEFTAAVVAPMLTEVDSFFADVTFGGGSFKDLFLSNVGFVNRDTAPLYGLDATQFGSDVTRVELDANQRPGVLTRVGFLSTFSHFEETAPVLRGAFVEKNVLGIDPGPPSPGVPMSLPPPGDYTSERRKVEALISQAACAGCHSILNPPGFVLEHYDAVGSWQDVDPLGGAIDGTADVVLSDTETKTISSPLELMTALAGSAGAQRRFAEQLVAYASGREPNPFDACTVETLAANLAQDGYAVRELFADYTQADSFRLRTVGN